MRYECRLQLKFDCHHKLLLSYQVLECQLMMMLQHLRPLLNHHQNKSPRWCDRIKIYQLLQLDQASRVRNVQPSPFQLQLLHLGLTDQSSFLRRQCDQIQDAQELRNSKYERLLGHPFLGRSHYRKVACKALWMSGHKRE